MSQTLFFVLNLHNLSRKSFLLSLGHYKDIKSLIHYIFGSDISFSHGLQCNEGMFLPSQITYEIFVSDFNPFTLRHHHTKEHRIIIQGNTRKIRKEIKLKTKGFQFLTRKICLEEKSKRWEQIE